MGMFEISKSFESGLIDLYKKSGLKILCEEMARRIEEKRSQILIAWYAEHDFEPGKAVIVKKYTSDGFEIYIREATAEELEAVQSKWKK